MVTIEVFLLEYDESALARIFERKVAAAQRFIITTYRYSLGTTIVPSSALFIRAMRS
jgi:hypothetical protein